MKDYSGERNLWAAVLNLFYYDAQDTALTDADVQQLLRQARSEHIRTICEILSVDHKSFVNKLDQVLDEAKFSRNRYRMTQKKTPEIRLVA